MHRLIELFTLRRDRRRPSPSPSHDAPAPARPPLTAEDIMELDKAAGGYAKRLARDVAAGALIVVVLAAVFGYVNVVSSYGQSPRLNLIRLDGGTVMGAFAVLAAMITGLQVAVRASADQAPDGRRRFLAHLATALIPGCLGLAVYVAGQAAWASGPKIIEPVGTLGSLLGGLALALLAADAGSAAMRVAKDEESLRAVQRANISELERRYATLAGSSRPPAKGAIALEVAGIVVTIGAVTFVPLAMGGVTKPKGLMLVAIGLVIAALFIWATTYVFSVALLLRSWINATFYAIGALAICIVVGAQLLQMVLEWSTAETFARNVGWTYATWSTFVIVISGFAIRSLGCDSKGRRLALRAISVWQTRRLLKGATNVTVAPSTPTIQRRLAVTAVWLSPLFPLGLLLGRVATQVDKETGIEHDQRTLRMIRRSRTLSWFWAALWVSACLGLAWWAPPVS